MSALPPISHPRRRNATRPLRRPSGSGRFDGRGLADLQVLVVDDDVASVKLLAAIFRSEGCHVRHAPSAEDALASIAEAPAELVVIDLVLPLMSGVLLAQSLRALDSMRDAVLVAVTAFHGPGVDRATQQAGFDAYLRKPLEASAFVQRLKALLEST